MVPNASRSFLLARICSDCSREEVPRLQRFARCFLSSELISSWCGILEDTLHGLELRSFQVAVGRGVARALCSSEVMIS